MQSIAKAETGLTITNPLVLYRALVATKKIQPDPAQHRLALHLQKLYNRLKDYEPTIEYRAQLEQVTRTLARSSGSSNDVSTGIKALGQERIRDTKAVSDNEPGRLSGLFRRLGSQHTKSMALTRRISSRDAALHIDSPQGLLLYGEVGTGKSMLIDLLADSLPNRKKRRYHFNAFMLDLFARIEQQRIEQLRRPNNGMEPEHTLLAMARDLISTCPILFLDEFQLPDRAASKIMSNLFTSFFQLGGVLIATSNRMPEELSKASGVEFALPSSPTTRLGFAGLGALLRGSAANDMARGVNSRQNDFTQFLDVLKARCESWNMESRTDFRRRESNSRRPRSAGGNSSGNETGAVPAGGPAEGEGECVEPTAADGNTLPAFFFESAGSTGMKDESLWQASVLRATGSPHPSEADVPWQRRELTVYGRKVGVPKVYEGTSLWTFEELCGAYLGPADFITLASTFHTLILVEVPVLTSTRKNEARRFITLLDALYESRCRLLIRANSGPDDLFFPEQRKGRGQEQPAAMNQEEEKQQDEQEQSDSVYAETLSEIYQDATVPFRPNVSTYGSNEQDEQAALRSIGPHSEQRSILADEDADFGPVYGAGRSTGTWRYVEASNRGGQDISSTGPNFQKTHSFTGQDEQFAYKRAESRLWELCSQGWWNRADQGQLWKPLDKEMRGWERERDGEAGDTARQAKESLPVANMQQHMYSSKGSGGDVSRHGTGPFRVVNEAAPKLSWTHVWGMMRWGRKAGTWGKGTDGIEERAQEKQRDARAVLPGAQRSGKERADG